MNYAVNAGGNRLYAGGVVNGVAWWLGGNPLYGMRVGFTAVRDGTSNTAAFSEWIKGKAGQNTPGLNLVYQIPSLSTRRTTTGHRRLHGGDDSALGLQGRVLDPSGYRAGRSVLSHHAAQQVVL